MSGREGEITVAKALHILRQRQFQATGRRSRSHLGALDENRNRIEALKGICGGCTRVRPVLAEQDGRDVVQVRCRAGGSPLNLYRRELGEPLPECPNFSPKIRRAA